MPGPISHLPTVGEIARRLNEPIHRVEYIIRARNVHPVGKAGNAFIYSEDAVNLIASQLHRIDAERRGDA